MSIEQTLADWASTFRNRHVDDARTVAQAALLDIAGCIVGGSVEPPTQAVIKVAKRFGSGAALALGSDLRLSAPWAALVGGTAAHALDFDDNFAPATTHATAVLAPALFALADEDNLSGASIVEAYIVGLELQARIGRIVNPFHYERGWHATSTVGTIGTAGACAHLLGLDSSQTLAAMSVAFSLAGGSKKQFGSMVKPIHAGFAAQHAVLAARMAQAGVVGDVEPLTGNWGFTGLYGDQDEKASSSSALADLGTILAIETDGLLLKRFPCCGAAHRTLDGLLELRETYGFSAEVVDHVEIFIPDFARANLRFDDPQNEMEARFSLNYCAARVLESGRLTLRDLTRERVCDPSIRSILRRFVIRTKPGSVTEELGRNATPAITRVALRSGAVHEIGIVAPKGSRQAPLTEQESRDKFYDCVRWAGKENCADRLFDAARSLHEMPRFSEFSRTFAECFSSL